jgi:hypothetical protein
MLMIQKVKVSGGVEMVIINVLVIKTEIFWDDYTILEIKLYLKT